MKTLGFGRRAFGIGLGVIMLAGCGATQTGGSLPVGAVAQVKRAQTVRI